ncbi:ABC transporter permease [Xanthovirga aplysinae]|uniref:ABC transporter permease n=1 Tax=Xanthovirga aplysinae TaxID=2529853 RepID=UPI0012BCD8A7|nr:ABC transporter permease [Xanthovirga aplysinae]MTI30789.1 FtsX-like permease family protein [Xanthovirga aplysinae]
MREKILANFSIALEAVLANKLRSVLTGLGIIFGVAAVISMMAIGNGAQKEILEQIKLVGVNNIVIKPIIEQSEEKLDEESEKREKKKFSPGLSLTDAYSILGIIPNIQQISPEVQIETHLIKNGIRRSAKLVGVEPNYFSLGSFELADGKMFNEDQLKRGEAVCIIGKSVQTKFFSDEDPIGKKIKCGSHWLKVIGVLKERIVSDKSKAALGVRDYNMDVYAPIKTVLIRYRNRSLITKAMLRKGNDEDEDEEKPEENYHQLDRLVVQVNSTESLEATAEIMSRMLKRRHYGVVDYEISIPELLLKQQQRTKSIFNIVLGAIAGISLLVGGIGIMNIMLASVLERIKEIGLRLAMGAKKQDIIIQFLLEAMMISVTGGIVGVLLGVTIALIISEIAAIPTIITFISVFISFMVAATVGLIFGIAPARKAASQNPIASLRYE